MRKTASSSILFVILSLPLLLGLSGCGATGLSPRGLIYTHITVPLDSNLDRTTLELNSEEGDIKVFRYYVDVQWDSNAIGDIAKQHGIEKVYFADLEELSVLGVWSQYTVHIYGK